MKKITEVTGNDLSNLQFELKREAEKESKKVHYVNNKALFAEFVKYNERKLSNQKQFESKILSDFGYIDIEEVNQQSEYHINEFQKALKDFTPPPLTNIIGKAILDISYKRCSSPRFVNYTPNWKEEMTSDAIETCVKYAHNFDPTKYDNPFAYLTQLITNAIFQRIKKEHKQQYIKLKMFDDSHGFAGEIDENSINLEDMELLDETNEIYRDRLEYINNYEEIQGLNKKRAKRKKKGEDDLENLLNID